MSDITTIAGGGVTSALGFQACGVKAGLKKSGNPDMALLFSEVPAVTAGAFTSNLFAAAPVKLCRQRLLAGHKISAVAVNSGNANASTGEKGDADAAAMAKMTADALKIKPEQVLVASTGRIGVHMPMDIIAKGVALAAPALVRDGGAAAARAIMTTDTKPKEFAVSVVIDGKTITVGGMAKGAGMIAPQVKVPHATMLVFLTTDAAVAPGFLSQVVGEQSELSFNRITVDNDMSTNDTVLLLANGLAGNLEFKGGDAASELFAAAVKAVMLHLAQAIVRDGEGATKFVTVRVENAASASDALVCAKAIANSLLCKTAWFGNDPNWGRIVCAAGYSGASFDPDKVNVHYNDKPVVLKGSDSGVPEAVLVEELKRDEFAVIVDLAAGTFSDTVWTNDISYEYVKINADYHT